MAIIKKLPDAEFEVMRVIWQFQKPVTAGMVLAEVETEEGKHWKLQTIHTLLGRLAEKGFLQSEKEGKERYFTPLIKQEEYLQFETQSFVNQYHRGSLFSLINAMYQGRELGEDEVRELAEWINQRKEEL